MSDVIPNDIIPKNPMAAAVGIDPVQVARAIVEDPRRKYTMSVLQITAICKALVATEDSPQSVITADLADAIRTLLATIESPPVPRPAFSFEDTAPPSALQAAFTAAKTLFEMEFPNVAE